MNEHRFRTTLLIIVALCLYSILPYHRAIAQACPPLSDGKTMSRVDLSSGPVVTGDPNGIHWQISRKKGSADHYFVKVLDKDSPENNKHLLFQKKNGNFSRYAPTDAGSTVCVLTEALGPPFRSPPLQHLVIGTNNDTVYASIGESAHQGYGLKEQ